MEEEAREERDRGGGVKTQMKKTSEGNESGRERVRESAYMWRQKHSHKVHKLIVH